MKEKEAPQFRWDEVLEDDCSWEYLEVSTDGGKTWSMAKPKFGTEDEEKIKEMLK